jgi:hypothetical protein
MTHPVTPLACHPSGEGVEEMNTPSPLRGTPPTLGGEFTDLEIPSPVFRQGESLPIAIGTLNERDLLKVSLTEGVPDPALDAGVGEGGLR